MADVFENEAEAEPTVTINDYLNAIEEEELEADLVLGGDEGKECTYNKGYVKRQAIFSCLTCTPEGNAGVCTACCLSCHDGHEMVELWTKRNFRCDCGNSKFGEFFCKLSANKDIENSENAYNHNFKGTYCTCDLQYPDPNAEDQVEMIQCCICEDWFHEEHIGLESPNEVPRDEEGEPLYEDFVCQGCAAVCSFLSLYAQSILVSNTPKDKAVVEQASAGTSSEKIENGAVSLGPSAEAADVSGTLSKKVENGDGSLAPSAEDAAISDKIPIDAIAESSLRTCTDNAGLCPAKDKAVVEQAPAGTSPAKIENANCSLASSVKNAAVSDKVPADGNAESSLKQYTENASSTECVLGIDLIKNSPTTENSKPMFLSKNWRDVLCRCKSCSDFYGQKGVGYLLDKEDTIAEYERMAKLKRNENMQKQEGAEQDFLNNLGHVEKIELLSGIADMKREFSAFLESSDPSKAITPDDVHQVFENLAKRRKRMP